MVPTEKEKREIANAKYIQAVRAQQAANSRRRSSSRNRQETPVVQYEPRIKSRTSKFDGELNGLKRKLRDLETRNYEDEEEIYFVNRNQSAVSFNGDLYSTASVKRHSTRKSHIKARDSAYQSFQRPKSNRQGKLTSISKRSYQPRYTVHDIGTQRPQRKSTVVRVNRNSENIQKERPIIRISSDSTLVSNRKQTTRKRNADSVLIDKSVNNNNNGDIIDKPNKKKPNTSSKPKKLSLKREARSKSEDSVIYVNTTGNLLPPTPQGNIYSFSAKRQICTTPVTIDGSTKDFSATYDFSSKDKSGLTPSEELSAKYSDVGVSKTKGKRSQSMTNNPANGRKNKNSLTKTSTAENSKTTKQGNLKIAKQETSITAKRENSKVSKRNSSSQPNRQNKDVGGRNTDEPVRVSKSRMSLKFQTGTDFPPLEDHPSFSIDKRKNLPSKRDSKQAKQSSTGQEKNLRVSFEQTRKPK